MRPSFVGRGDQQADEAPLGERRREPGEVAGDPQPAAPPLRRLGQEQRRGEEGGEAGFAPHPLPEGVVSPVAEYATRLIKKAVVGTGAASSAGWCT